jgi:hypothetical protein
MKDQKNLDSIFFWVKRDKVFNTICFSDLEIDEMDRVMKGKSIEWLNSLVYILEGLIHDTTDGLNYKDELWLKNRAKKLGMKIYDSGYIYKGNQRAIP